MTTISRNHQPYLRLRKTFYVASYNIETDEDVLRIYLALNQAKREGYEMVRDQWCLSGTTTCPIDLAIKEFEKRLR